MLIMNSRRSLRISPGGRIKFVYYITNYNTDVSFIKSAMTYERTVDHWMCSEAVAYEILISVKIT